MTCNIGYELTACYVSGIGSTRQTYHVTQQPLLTLTVLVTAIDALGHFETG